jgi:GTP cyclohydrolase I
VAVALESDPRIGSYRVEVVNHESIHAHDAYAVIERQR